MSQIVVLGNGESRLNFKFDNYKNDCILIGCNAIHRDIYVDHLVCCDRKMAEEVTNNEQTKTTIVYVRQEHYHYFKKIRKNKNIRLVPDLPYQGERREDQPNHWGSGVYAVLVACLLNPNEIDLFGFDLYGKNSKINNVYKGSKNYKEITSSAVDPTYWIYQISKLFDCFPKINFNIHNYDSWQLPTQWQQKNVKKLNISCSINKYLL